MDLWCDKLCLVIYHWLIYYPSVQTPCSTVGIDYSSTRNQSAEMYVYQEYKSLTQKFDFCVHFRNEPDPIRIHRLSGSSEVTIVVIDHILKFNQFYSGTGCDIWQV